MYRFKFFLNFPLFMAAVGIKEIYFTYAKKNHELHALESYKSDENRLSWLCLNNLISGEFDENIPTVLQTSTVIPSYAKFKADYMHLLNATNLYLDVFLPERMSAYFESVTARQCRQVEVFAVSGRSLFEYKLNFMNMIKNCNWNRHAQFVILGVKYVDVRPLLAILLEYYQIYNVIVLERENNSVIRIFKPKMEADFCGDEFIIESVGTCTLTNNSLAVHKVAPVFIKVELSFHWNYTRCVWYTAGPRYWNIIEYFLRLFENRLHLNYSHVYKQSWKMDPNEYHLGLGNLVNPQETLSSYSSLQHSTEPANYIVYDYLVLFTPRAQQLSMWFAISHIFTALGWLSIVVAFAIMLCAWSIHSVNKVYPLLLLNIADSLYRAILAMGMENVQAYLRDRILAMTWILYSFYMIQIFGSCYFDFLMLPYFEPQLKTPQQINDAKVEVHCRELFEESMRDYFDKVVTPGDETKLYQRGPNEKKNYFAELLASMKHKKVAVLYEAFYLNFLKFPENGTSFIYADFDNIFYEMTSSFQFNLKQNPLINDANRYIRYFHEHGFYNYFEMYYWPAKKIIEKFRNGDLSASSLFSLNMDHVAIPFQILLGGLILSAMVLVIELLWTQVKVKAKA